MQLHFHKYQGTGNDFILIDDRRPHFPEENKTLISWLCDRKMGIGADGVILIQNHPELDFRMVYFNPDGSRSLCGNGSRCAMAFARHLGIISDTTTFETTDGIHDGFIKGEIFHFRLHDVQEIQTAGNDLFINTGSPHHIRLVDQIESTEVIRDGSEIRFSTHYAPKGTNVNFVEKQSGGISVRTYERGVEGETLSCGTGVTACALAASRWGYDSPVNVSTKGGQLTVSFTQLSQGGFENIYLAGPAKKVYEGSVEVPT